VERRATTGIKPGTIHFHALDLGSVKGARLSAASLEEKLKADGNRLDVLVNNAGIANMTPDLSPDGFERTFAVNCLGHFAFTDAIMGKSSIERWKTHQLYRFHQGFSQCSRRSEDHHNLVRRLQSLQKAKLRLVQKSN
jgi:NAD(P)-dependent dehydrogenase (short-subunit alcohol dehydrogenase family)